MIPDRPRQQVVVGNNDLTERCDSLSYSATDAGGYEVCTLGLPADDQVAKGDLITVRQGLEVAWQGRVAETDSRNQDNDASKTVGGEGLRSLLRDTVYSMVYADRDLTQWGDPSLTRQIALVQASQGLQSSQAGADPTTLNPSLMQVIQGDWNLTAPICEAWYDAGPGNLISKLYYSLALQQALTGTWDEQLELSSDANRSGFQTTGNLDGAASKAGYFTPATPWRFALARHDNTNTTAGQAGVSYIAYWQNLAVYGNHGLTGRGPDPVGFYPSDIAGHALSQCRGLSPGTIADAFSYIAPHVVYKAPVSADQVVDDMAKLMGWHWGVWEPASPLAFSPRMDFRPPPFDATCVLSRSECDQLDITSRLGDLYNVCEVSYTDAAGTQALATVTLANPALAEAGISTRPLRLSMGLASLASAQAFGLFALQLSQVAARAAGTVTLPTSVRLIGGGSKPACLVRPGIDRLRISDLPDTGSLLDMASNRRDVFRVSRVESTVARDGSVSTVAELDNGANLLETLQARLALAGGVVGSGAG